MLEKIKDKFSDAIVWCIASSVVLVIIMSVMAAFALPILGVIWLCKMIF